MEKNNNCKGSFQPMSITEDLDRYADTFMNGFWPNTEDVEVIRQWLRNDFEKEVVSKITSLMGNDRSAISVMGVGAGDGSMDEIMIEKLHQHYTKINYTVVEPGNVIEQFQQRADESDELTGVQFTWKNTTYDEFCQSDQKKGRKFSFISLIHSVYYLEKLDESLRYLMGSLEEGGVLMIIVNRDNNDLQTFLSTLSWKTQNTQSRRVDEIKAFAVAENIPCTTHLLKAKVNITPCFDETSEEGDKLLDFLTETAYLRRTAPIDILGETLAVMKTVSKEGVAGLRYFDLACDAILLVKDSV